MAISKKEYEDNSALRMVNVYEQSIDENLTQGKVYTELINVYRFDAKQRNVILAELQKKYEAVGWSVRFVGPGDGEMKEGQTLYIQLR